MASRYGAPCDEQAGGKLRGDHLTKRYAETYVHLQGKG